MIKLLNCQPDIHVIIDNHISYAQVGTSHIITFWEILVHKNNELYRSLLVYPLMLKQTDRNTCISLGNTTQSNDVVRKISQVVLGVYYGAATISP